MSCLAGGWHCLNKCNPVTVLGSLVRLLDLWRRVVLVGADHVAVCGSIQTVNHLTCRAWLSNSQNPTSLLDKLQNSIKPKKPPFLYFIGLKWLWFRNLTSWSGSHHLNTRKANEPYLRTCTMYYSVFVEIEIYTQQVLNQIATYHMNVILVNKFYIIWSKGHNPIVQLKRRSHIIEAQLSDPPTCAHMYNTTCNVVARRTHDHSIE